jgi:RNA ligase (TIGR02306 family)
MRQLASIQRIVDIQPIPNADKIECATVLGWKCVVKKGEFKTGDLVLYVEPDSLLPFNPWTGELLGDKPLRLKTVRMKGQISQGLVLNTGLPQLAAGNWLVEGTDVSEVLGIKKYEPPPLPEALAGIARGVFPSFLVKTDETRIQAFPAVITRHAGKSFAVTEKLDGTSTSYYWHDRVGDGSYAFGACSRNLDLEPGNGAQWTIAANLGLREALTKEQVDNGRSLALQGELVGPNIQSNKLKLPSVTWFAFNAYDIVRRQFLSHDEVTEWCARNNIPHVPVIERGFKLDDHNVDSLIKYVTRKSLLNPEVWIEGGVFRPLIEEHDPDLGRLSFKAINPEFLLKYGE